MTTRLTDQGVLVDIEIPVVGTITSWVVGGGNVLGVFCAKCNELLNTLVAEEMTSPSGCHVPLK